MSVAIPAVPAPTDKDAARAHALYQALTSLSRAEKITVKIRDKHFELPRPIVAVLLGAAKLVSQGHTVGVVPADDEISAQDAADILKVSRPYLLNLVKKGVLPCRMVGAHHRIPMNAVLAYKQDQAPRRRALEALTAETQELGR
jgi:excisionase family DNA binding protein